MLLGTLVLLLLQIPGSKYLLLTDYMLLGTLVLLLLQIPGSKYLLLTETVNF